MKLGLNSLTNAEYHAAEGISKTKLDIINSGDDSAIQWAKDCPVDSEKLKTFDFGDAAHAIILEPERLASDFAVMPDLNLRTKQGKADAEAFRAENSHKAILTASEYSKLELMRDSVFSHPGCKKWLSAPGEAEQSWFWTDHETGELCKCRPDRNIFNSPFILDVKTTEDIKKFHFSVEDYRYFVQAPWYTDGMTQCGEEKTTMVFLVIQKTIECGRYPVRLLTIPDRAIEYGRAEYRRNLRAYAEAKQRGFSNSVVELDMGYRFNKTIENKWY